MQLQLGLVLTQWLHALSPQQDNRLNPVFVPHTTGLRHVVVPHTTVSTPSWSLSLRAVIEFRHEWLQLGVVPHTAGLRHVVVPHTTVATRYFPPGLYHD